MTELLTRERIVALLSELNEELAAKKVRAEMFLVGGAVMCLAFGARPATRDIDAIFEPKSIVYECATVVGERHKLPPGWLNDGAKGFQSDRGSFSRYELLQYSNLAIYTSDPDYLLAMKIQSCRLGEAFQDRDDILFLLKLLNVKTVQDAIDIATKFYAEALLPNRAWYVLEECIAEG